MVEKLPYLCNKDLSFLYRQIVKDNNFTHNSK